MERLASANSLVVSQKKEWGKTLTDFETRNKYAVSDATSGASLYLTAEEAGSTLARIFLKAMRPFTIVVLGTDGQPVLRIRRPFRVYYHQAEVEDSRGQRLGTIVRQLSLARRIYSVLDASGTEVCQLFGPLLRPWTFEIMINGSESGQIQKKWSGLLKEGFTDADNFGVTFPVEHDARMKAVILGAVFLIDFVHFEDKGN
jgi:uncharacterized protein YxjI